MGGFPGGPWLRLCTSTAGGMGWIPGQELRPHMPQGMAKKEKHLVWKMVVGVCRFVWGYGLDSGVYRREWCFLWNCPVLFADLCDHALHISHDELWTTGAAQTDKLDGSPPGGEEGGNAFYIMFLLKWTEKIWNQKYELCCLSCPELALTLGLKVGDFKQEEKKGRKGKALGIV